MSLVRTVLGDLPVTELSTVDAHDHLFLDLGLAPRRAEMLLAAEEEVRDELVAYAAAGGGAVVCATPIGLGRRPLELAAAARDTGVHVIATTGFHRSSYYAAGHWCNTYPLSVVAELVHADVTEGIDRYDYAGPVVERTGVRAGMVKAGADFHRFAGREEALHRVAAEVADMAGVPLLLHVEHGADPHRQLDAVTAAGLPPQRVLVSHLDRNPDATLHRSVAARGAYLVYDGLFRERYRPDSAIVDLVEGLAGAGFSDRLLLGADLAVRAYRRATGAPGIAGLLTVLVPRIRERLGDALTDRLLTTNARVALAIREPHERIST